MRGRDTVRVTKVEGHADAEMVRVSHVLEISRIGNDAADELTLGAEGLIGLFLMRAVTFLVFAGAGALLLWICVVSLLLSVVMWSILMEEKVQPSTLSFGLLVLFPRGVGWSMLCETTPCCLDLRLSGSRRGLVFQLQLLLLKMQVPGLTRLVFWLNERLSWELCIGRLLGLAGVSYVEQLLLYELWAGERLVLEKALPRYRTPGPPISVSTVPFGPGIDMWRSCRFVWAVMMSLCALPGGMGRFVPCMIGANHCRLRQIGWEKCGHGLTSRPRETASAAFL